MSITCVLNIFKCSFPFSVVYLLKAMKRIQILIHVIYQIWKILLLFVGHSNWCYILWIFCIKFKCLCPFTLNLTLIIFCLFQVEIVFLCTLTNHPYPTPVLSSWKFRNWGLIFVIVFRAIKQIQKHFSICNYLSIVFQSYYLCISSLHFYDNLLDLLLITHRERKRELLQLKKYF